MSITRSYYRNADGCVLVYDITRKETFQNLPRWLREAEENTNNPQLVTILVGNKADLTDRRQVSTQEAAEFAAANGLMFMEVSVRTAFGDVEEVFRRATRRIVELQSQDNDDEDYSGPGSGAGYDSEPASPVPEPARTSGNAGAGTARRVSPATSPAPAVRPARLTNQNRCVIFLFARSNFGASADDVAVAWLSSIKLKKSPERERERKQESDCCS